MSPCIVCSANFSFPKTMANFYSGWIWTGSMLDAFSLSYLMCLHQLQRLREYRVSSSASSASYKARQRVSRWSRNPFVHIKHQNKTKIYESILHEALIFQRFGPIWINLIRTLCNVDVRPRKTYFKKKISISNYHHSYLSSSDRKLTDSMFSPFKDAKPI